MRIIVLTVVLGLSLADHIDKNAETRSYTNSLSEDGSYHYDFETSNGISVQQTGTGGYLVAGTAQWVDPEGTPVSFSYTADENGYQAEGDIIPTPPPVPEYVLRALEYIRDHPPEERLAQYQRQLK